MKLEGHNSFEPIISYLVLASLSAVVAGFYLLPTTQATSVASYLLLAVTLIYFASGNTPRFGTLHSPTTFYSGVAFFGYMFLTTFWGQLEVGPVEQSKVLIQIITVITLLLAVPIVESMGFSKRLLQIIVGCASCSAISRLASIFFEHNSILGSWNTDSVGALVYGFALIISIFLFSSARSNLEKTLTVISSALLGLILVVLNLSVVWFALMASVTSLCLLKVWSTRRSTKSTIWIVLSFIMMLSTTFLLHWIVDQGRAGIWVSTINEAFATNLLFGNGTLHSVKPVVDCSQSPTLLSQFPSCKFDHAHNVYVMLISQGGLLSLLLLINFIISSVSESLNTGSEWRWLAFILLAFGLASTLFDGSDLIGKFNYLWLVFWFPLGMFLRFR